MREWESVAPGDLIDMPGKRYVFTSMDRRTEWVRPESRLGDLNISDVTFVVACYIKPHTSDYMAALFYVVHPVAVGWVRIEPKADDHTIQSPEPELDSSSDVPRHAC